MVKSIFFLALSAGMAFHAACADGIPDGTQPVLQRLHLPEVKSISIDENGTKSTAAQDTPAECNTFVLDKRDVREYLEHAGSVTQHDYFHMLDWSPCYASGKVVFKNGLAGTWAVQQFRAGSLSLSDGRTLYLYCPGCKAKAFAGQ